MAAVTRMTLPVAGLEDVRLIKAALTAAARARRSAAEQASAVLEADRADGEDITGGALALHATLAEAARLDRLAVAVGGALERHERHEAPAPVAPAAPAVPLTPAFVAPEPAPVAQASPSGPPRWVDEPGDGEVVDAMGLLS
jgi:hypothetical protein